MDSLLVVLRPRIGGLPAIQLGTDLGALIGQTAAWYGQGEYSRLMNLLIFLITIALVCGCRSPEAIETPSSAVPTVTPTTLSQNGTLSTPSIVKSSPTPPAPTPPVQLSDTQTALLRGARSTLGNVYDDAYYGGGPPPEGRGACTDVIYSAYLAAGTDLQDAIERDILDRPAGYPNLGDRNINYRRAPNLIVWFERHTQSLPLDSDFQPGDVVFWSLLDDGVADHVGLVSDEPGYVIHNIGPRCREDASLDSWTVLGHFR